MRSYNDDSNYIDIKLPAAKEKRKNSKYPDSRTSRPPQNSKNHGAVRKASPASSKRRSTKKKSPYSKYSLYFVLFIIVIALIIAVAALFSHCGAGNDMGAATLDESNGMEIITITIKGDAVFYNGKQLDGLEVLKNTLEKEYNHNKTINFVHDDANQATYENVNTIIQKIESDEIKEKESIAAANETTAPVTSVPQTQPTSYERADYESDSEQDGENGQDEPAEDYDSYD